MEYIAFTALLGLKDKNDLKPLQKWLGTDHPSKDYQKLTAQFVADILTAAKLPDSDFPAFERFSTDIDHSENHQWNNEFSTLVKIGKQRWKLGNAEIKKGDIAWVRLGGRWILAKFEYSQKNGYSLLVEPEKSHIPLSTELKMRWGF